MGIDASVKRTMETFDIIKGEIDTIKARNEAISKNQGMPIISQL